MLVAVRHGDELALHQRDRGPARQLGRDLDRLRQRPDLQDHERDRGVPHLDPRRHRRDAGALVLRITIDPTDPGIVYTTFSGFASDNVWRTTDGGATAAGWTARAGTGADSLPSAPVRDIAVNPANHNWIYAGTEIGVFASTDGGAHWACRRAGPRTCRRPAVLAGHDLVAATHGRGMFRTDVTIPQPPNDDFASAQTLTGTSATRPSGHRPVPTRRPESPTTRPTAAARRSGTAGPGVVGRDHDRHPPERPRHHARRLHGHAVDGLTEVTSNDDEDFASNVFTSKATFTATAGVTYQIAVDGFRSSNGVCPRAASCCTWPRRRRPARGP